MPALLACAQMFRARCLFRAPFPAPAERPSPGALQAAPPLDVIRRAYDHVLALETDPVATNLFRFRAPIHGRIALFVGNERRGLSPGVRRLADELLRIPMRGGWLSSLNVAASAVIGCHQLGFARAGGRGASGHGRRPDILFVDPTDPAQLGVSLRTAWALGWDRVYLADGHHVWFATDRETYAWGRGAARRHKNPVRVLPFDLTRPTRRFASGLVVGTCGRGAPLGRRALPIGPSSLILIPEHRDEPSASATRAHSIVGQLEQVRLGTPAQPGSVPFALVTGIVLAEVALWSPPPKHEEPFSTPRSWHMLSDALHSYGERLTDPLLEALAYGTLSPHHAAQFKAFARIVRNRYAVDRILKGEERWPSAPEDRDILYFLAQSFRAQLVKELPPKREGLAGAQKALVHLALTRIKELAQISLEIAQMVVGEAEDGAGLPNWLRVDIVRVLPRLAERR